MSLSVAGFCSDYYFCTELFPSSLLCYWVLITFDVTDNKEMDEYILYVKRVIFLLLVIEYIEFYFVTY